MTAKRYISWIMSVCFFCTSVPGPGFALPASGAMAGLTPSHVPVMMKGLKVHPDNPLLFDFILDTGKSGLKAQDEAFRAESEKLIKYFLAALTIKEEDMWVNLSPYEKDRVIADDLGKTGLGREMLAQDHVLKQLTASLMSPEDEPGREFWSRVYAGAQERFGTTDIPVDTFNKVWITGDRARVLERDNTGYVVAMHLKVMLETDHLAMSNNPLPTRGHVAPFANVSPSADLAQQIMREVVLPVLETEVNEGVHFAPLRQIFASMILAAWYKRALKDALLNRVYADQAKTGGIEAGDALTGEQIYARYLEAYKKGVFDQIREEFDPATGDVVPRKYFSGGVVPGEALRPEVTGEAAPGDELGPAGDAAVVTTRIDKAEDKARPDGKKALTVRNSDVFTTFVPSAHLSNNWREGYSPSTRLRTLLAKQLGAGADEAWESIASQFARFEITVSHNNVKEAFMTKDSGPELVAFLNKFLESFRGERVTFCGVWTDRARQENKGRPRGLFINRPLDKRYARTNEVTLPPELPLEDVTVSVPAPDVVKPIVTAEAVDLKYRNFQPGQQVSFIIRPSRSLPGETIGEALVRTLAATLGVDPEALSPRGLELFGLFSGYEVKIDAWRDNEGNRGSPTIFDVPRDWRHRFELPMSNLEGGLESGYVRFIGRLKGGTPTDKAQAPGGIDLNAQRLGLDTVRDGNPMSMTFDPALIDQFSQGDLPGVVPVIIKITPLEGAVSWPGLGRGRG